LIGQVQAAGSVGNVEKLSQVAALLQSSASLYIDQRQNELTVGMFLGNDIDIVKKDIKVDRFLEPEGNLAASIGHHPCI
jgi:hypothetical protein